MRQILQDVKKYDKIIKEIPLSSNDKILGQRVLNYTGLKINYERTS